LPRARKNPYRGRMSTSSDSSAKEEDRFLIQERGGSAIRERREARVEFEGHSVGGGDLHGNNLLIKVVHRRRTQKGMGGRGREEFRETKVKTHYLVKKKAGRA